MLTLADLYYEVHSRFFETDFDIYCEAMSVITDMAHRLGGNTNELARLVTYSD